MDIETEPKKKKHGGGPKRRIFYKDKYDQILKAFSLGHGIPRICKILDCTPQRLNQLKHEDEELFSVLEKGKALAQEWWETKGQQSLAKKGFNSSLYALFMANKFGWSGKHKIEGELKTTSENEVTLKFDDKVTNSLIDKLLETE